ncbi:MAG: NADH dehydrogenase [Actinobacteria bacterium RBG_13_35_12]|uniref:NADH dehydrogenase n=1 Tax=Candidatus Sediminicultor quintus TaxID=1797291 RepID=A0A1F5AC15_9BACT|nr:MAG: NADH dehydrogenase [Actinobacteria bacterium RBG_13_35_12]OGD15826.1 MAG: NADH dehydrogenase [Candidatus Atribacteria bacterium RBG_19FT_COMBO_35_14]OGD31169.1 MAG: NADH dehydrogenase [Candidatus Atribacteria bacterium RBG_16_35_8]
MGCPCDEKELTDKQKYKQLKEFINESKNKKGYLIPVLHMAQVIFGFLPPEVQNFVAKEMNTPVSVVTGVVTFYSYFKIFPTGRHTITICLGTACYVRGAKKIMEELEKKLGIKIGETTEDKRFSMGVQRCLGACGLAPVIMIDKDVHGRISAQKLDKILELYK